MSYEIFEIPGIKTNWVIPLAKLRVGDVMHAKPEDRNKIATSVSTNFHKKKLARFKVYLNPNNKQELLVERTA